MKQTTFGGKTSRQTTSKSQQGSSAGQNAVSISPPDYGIAFVDSDPSAMPLQRSSGSLIQATSKPEPTAQRQAVKEEEEEKAIQAKSLAGQITPLVQRQPVEEEEDEPIQAKSLAKHITPLVQRQPDEEEEEEVLQGIFTTSETPAQLQDDVGEAENCNGMPRPLKAGLEALSGMDLSGIRVHTNSSKPAQLNALAYTQGQDIHVAPGQEKHLPHESWHAVQQMQGRVKPTMQTQGVSINDDAGLERESDVMGAKALQMKGAEQATKGESEVLGKAIGTSGEKVRLNFLSTVHDTAADQAAANGLNAKAFTYRDHVSLAPGASAGDRNLLAHELTHVVQQGGAGQRIQRYEAGEHAQLGETQAEVKPAFAPIAYPVKKGERLRDIAKKFTITVEELKAANKDKLKRWPAKGGGGRMIEGFEAGEVVSIPKKLNELAKAVTKDKAAKFRINGVVLEYGVGMAMGDFFESPEQMAKASAKEIKALAALIKREQSGGKPATTEEWQQATGGRYLELAEKNAAHFAPPSRKLVTPTAAGAASPNHKKEWQKHHKSALDVSKSGDKDKALATNAYGDHYLTDAFSTGHLTNKRDVMEKFKSQFQLDKKGEEFIGPSKKFFDDVAKDAFTGAVKTEFSKYETFAPYKAGWRPNINDPDRFSSLLQGIHKKKPDLVAGAVAKGVHDRLNVVPGGVPVENAVGDRWNLSGDGRLNAQTKAIAKKAVAQSLLNLTSVYKSTTAIKYGALFKKVWDYTPRPSVAGLKQIVREIRKGVVLGSAALKKAVVKLIKGNYKLIIEKLVERKELRKA
ncbi:DUF4157 domain-containing protein [Planctomycetota bacterium]